MEKTHKRKSKIIRITTVPSSLKGLLRGQLKFMSDTYNVIGVSSKGEVLEEVKRDEGVEVVSINMTRTISPLKDLKALIQLFKLLKKEKPLIVHTHTPKAGTLGMIAAKLAGVPHRLHTIAGMPLLEAIGFKRKLLNLVEKITYACATMIYPNSFGLKKIIIDQKFCKSSKLKVLANGSSNGINTNYFDPSLFSEIQVDELKNSLGIKNNDIIFIFVGRLVSDKGINEMVEAFKRLNKGVKSVKLLLVGPFESDLDPLSKKTMKEIETNNSILEVGFQNDVRPYFAISNVLVFPSYREGFPNVVMQAGAMGLPSIVSDINGCNEIIIDGKNGLVIPVKDSEVIYNTMKKILIKESLRSKLKKNARSMIVSRYEQQVVWDAILGEYKSLEQNV